MIAGMVEPRPIKRKQVETEEEPYMVAKLYLLQKDGRNHESHLRKKRNDQNTTSTH